MPKNSSWKSEPPKKTVPASRDGGNKNGGSFYLDNLVFKGRMVLDSQDLKFVKFKKPEKVFLMCLFWLRLKYKETPGVTPKK
jgi:hypothetical protein